MREELTALPELSVTEERQKLVARTAKMFLLKRRARECPCRFDVLAIGRAPVVRLHKDAFSPPM